MGRTKRKKRKKKLAVNNAPFLTSQFKRIKLLWKDKSPVFRFILTFSFCLIFFYGLYTSTFFTTNALNPLTSWEARISSYVLNLFGQQTSVENTFLKSNLATLDIKKGCDGIEPTAFYLIGVLLMPLSWRSKAWGVGIGLVVLLFLNILRIVGLYFSFAYWPTSFEFFHVHGGFALFFILTVIIWIIWIRWAIRETQKAKQHAIK